ncbi:MAG: hypothetical protein JWM21_1206 [Acidobacteria bacterium]|nr:hypothetical protein [Acidobacteriota bacterium]
MENGPIDVLTNLTPGPSASLPSSLATRLQLTCGCGRGSTRDQKGSHPNFFTLDTGLFDCSHQRRLAAELMTGTTHREKGNRVPRPLSIAKANQATW